MEFIPHVFRAGSGCRRPAIWLAGLPRRSSVLWSVVGEPLVRAQLFGEFRQFNYHVTEHRSANMPGTIAHMSKQEFAQMLSTVVEQKLVELFGDPDDGLVLKENLRRRLIRQTKAVSKGERGDDFLSVRKRLGV